MLSVGPTKTNGSWWRGLTEYSPLEKGMANHFSILALRTPWIVWKGKKVGHWKMNYEMVGQHHRLNWHGFGWTLGVGDWQGGLASYSSRGHKESDTDWATELNWMLSISFHAFSSFNPHKNLARQVLSPFHRQRSYNLEMLGMVYCAGRRASKQHVRIFSYVCLIPRNKDSSHSALSHFNKTIPHKGTYRQLGFWLGWIPGNLLGLLSLKPNHTVITSLLSHEVSSATLHSYGQLLQCGLSSVKTPTLRPVHFTSHQPRGLA